MTYYYPVSVSDEHGVYKLQLDNNGFSPKIIDIYCKHTPEKISNYLYKVCSLCIVGEDINIFPHKNDFLDISTTYNLVKTNIKKIIEAA